MTVISKTEETNAVTTFYVSKLAGPRLNKRRVAKGETVEMSEHQARALLAAGELVREEADVDDPFGEVERAKAAEAEAAKAKADRDAADARAAAEKAEAEARAKAEKAAADAKAAAEAKAAKKADTPPPAA